MLDAKEVAAALQESGVGKAAVAQAVEAARGSGPVHSEFAENTFDALAKYGQDLTANASKLDPVIGRDDEIRRVIRVLCRRTKNNPVLVGDPGGCPAGWCVSYGFPKPNRALQGLERPRSWRAWRSAS